MKIAYLLTRSDVLGGACIHVRDLAAAVQKQGHRTMVAIGGHGPFVKSLADINVPVVSIPHLGRSIDPIRDLRALHELILALRRFRPDIICAHTAKAGVLGRMAGAALRVPVILTAHGWSITNKVGLRQGRIYGRVERLAARYTARIIDVCQSEKNLALSHGIGTPQQHVVVHNGVPDVSPNLVANQSASESPRIVMIARLEFPKDHASLLHALATLKQLDWNLDLIGDGQLEQSIRRLALELGLIQRVRFLGSQSSPEDYLARANIFVLSSVFEGFPLTILEAMRAGLPVIGSNVGGIPEAVAHGRTGLLVSNIDDLSSALDLILQNHSLRIEMGNEGRKRYTKLFTFERMLARTLKVYTHVLHARRSGVECDSDFARNTGGKNVDRNRTSSLELSGT